MRYVRLILVVALAAFALSSCDSEEKKVKSLMEAIHADFDSANYAQCIADIDTLRSRHPKAVEARKEALKIYKEASLLLAQQKLAVVDQLLQAAEVSYDSLNAIVEQHRVDHSVTKEEFDSLTMLRMRRDSLKGAFDVECAKIKYIHKKQKED